MPCHAQAPGEKGPVGEIGRQGAKGEEGPTGIAGKNPVQCIRTDLYCIVLRNVFRVLA